MSTDPSNAPARRRRGRRPGPSDSRPQVLDAARARFAFDGPADGLGERLTRAYLELWDVLTGRAAEPC